MQNERLKFERAKHVNKPNQHFRATQFNHHTLGTRASDERAAKHILLDRCVPHSVLPHFRDHKQPALPFSVPIKQRVPEKPLNKRALLLHVPRRH